MERGGQPTNLVFSFTIQVPGGFLPPSQSHLFRPPHHQPSPLVPFACGRPQAPAVVNVLEGAHPCRVERGGVDEYGGRRGGWERSLGVLVLQTAR